MPPIDSDASDIDEGIPFELETAKGNPDVEDSDAEDGDEEEYIVERITAHRFDKSLGTMMYHVKWEGYENEDDMTWEPESNLETAAVALKSYFKQVGGRPEPPVSGKKRGPKSGSKKRPAEEDTPDVTPAKGRGRGRKKQNTGGSDDDESSLDVQRVIDVPSKKTKYPPQGKKDWDEYIAAIRTIEESPNKMGIKERHGVIAWDDNTLTRHRLNLLHEKAPKAMLKFYESNLVFKSNEQGDLDTNGSIHAVED